MATDPDPEGDDLVPISAINALLYCDRRAALRHLDMLYVHNEHTRSGDLLHRRADRMGVERRRGVRTERGLWIASRRLRLYGRADLVEFHRPPGRRKAGEPVIEVPLPVEYKQGRKRRWDNDDIQLCAQALCLEEMLGRDVPQGAIYHAQSKTRRAVVFGPELRARPRALSPGCMSCSPRVPYHPPFSSRAAVAARSAATACPKHSLNPAVSPG